MRAEAAGAVDHHGLAGDHRRQQRGDLLRAVLQVGVADDHVVAGRGLRGRTDRGALALVALVRNDPQPSVVEPLQQGERAVGAAVVDSDQLDLAGVLDIENPLDRHDQGRRLVVDRHQDGQLHVSPPFRKNVHHTLVRQSVTQAADSAGRAGKGMHVAGRTLAQGTITRGTTNPNRLRRVDRWLAGPCARTLAAATDPLVVDLGYGASPVTTLELGERLRTVRADVEVVGIEIDPVRVRDAQPYTVPGVSFRHGGFELPVDGRRAHPRAGHERAAAVPRERCRRRLGRSVPPARAGRLGGRGHVRRARPARDLGHAGRRRTSYAHARGPARLFAATVRPGRETAQGADPPQRSR